MPDTTSVDRAVNDGVLKPDLSNILHHKAFIALREKRGGLAVRLSISMLVIYYGFILLVAFAPGILATPILGIVSLGILMGLGVIFSSIVLTGIYVRRANTEFDHLTAELQRSVK